MSNLEFNDVELNNSLNTNFKKAYINNASGRLIIGWSKPDSLVWLILFGPFFYWSKNIKLLGAITFIPYFAVVVNCLDWLIGRGIDPFVSLWAIIYTMLLIGAKKRILKKALKSNTDIAVISSGENLILSKLFQRDKIIEIGFKEFLKKQQAEVASEQKKQDEDEIARKKNRLVEEILKIHKKSIINEKQKFDFVDEEGFGIYPSGAKILWNVADYEILKLKEQAEHIKTKSDISLIEGRLEKYKLDSIGSNKRTLMKDGETISINLDKEIIKIKAITVMQTTENQVTTKAEKVTTQYNTTGINVANVTSIGNMPIGLSTSKTTSETKVQQERGYVELLVKIELNDRRKFSLRNKYPYTGNDLDVSYFRFIELKNYINEIL